MVNVQIRHVNFHLNILQPPVVFQIRPANDRFVDDFRIQFGGCEIHDYNNHLKYIVTYILYSVFLNFINQQFCITVFYSLFVFVDLFIIAKLLVFFWGGSLSRGFSNSKLFTSNWLLTRSQFRHGPVADLGRRSAFRSHGNKNPDGLSP